METFKDINKPKLSLREKMAYGAGDFGNGLMFDLGLIYLLKFYTDVLGISSFYGGLVFLVAKLFDAFVDTGVGALVDSRNKIGPKGKFRPFILYGTLPLAFLTIVSFISPDFSDQGKIIWAFATYLLFNVAYSVVNIPYGSLSASMTLNSDDRTQLSVFRNFGSQGAMFITGIIVIPMISLFDSVSVGYPIVIGGLALIGVIFHILCYKGVKERFIVERDENEKKGSELRAFKGLFKNGPFIVLIIFTLLSITSLFLKQQSQLYYFQYVLGEQNLVGIVSVLNIITLIPALFLTTFLNKKFGKKYTAIIGLLGFAIAEAANFLISGEHVMTFLIINCVSQFFLVIPNTVVWAFISDIVDYSQWKTGVRSEGIIYSSYSFARKVSQALAGFIPGMALTIIGYQPNVQQTAGTIHGLKILYFIVPGVAVLLALIIFGLFYTLTDKKHKRIVSELALFEKL
ncbi:glycoside-pentoside-hexuronide (GPH):cation symporter [Mammaliicoccus sciuri]|nr:glycoside-pentoside-hexuronide (GPH):cation symporter [Mammaliicoccus sciuri]